MNKWIEHVRAYAKANNISYGCAVSEAKASYVKAPAKPRAKASKNPKSPKKRKVTKKQAKEEEDFFKKFIDL